MDYDIDALHSQPGTSEHQPPPMENHLFGSWDASLLVHGWQTHDSLHSVLSCLVVAIIAFLLEALKRFRQHLELRSLCHRQHAYIVQSNAEQSGSLETKGALADELPSSTQTRCCRVNFSAVCFHLLQSILHMTQMAVSYGLMLIFMSFNMAVCLSIIVGFGVGYFVFEFKRAVMGRGGDSTSSEQDSF